MLLAVFSGDIVFIQTCGSRLDLMRDIRDRFAQDVEQTRRTIRRELEGLRLLDRLQ